MCAHTCNVYLQTTGDIYKRAIYTAGQPQSVPTYAETLGPSAPSLTKTLQRETPHLATRPRRLNNSNYSNRLDISTYIKYDHAVREPRFELTSHSHVTSLLKTFNFQA